MAFRTHFVESHELPDARLGLQARGRTSIILFVTTPHTMSVDCHGQQASAAPYRKRRDKCAVPRYHTVSGLRSTAHAALYGSRLP